jgi:predicted ester cyclase
MSEENKALVRRAWDEVYNQRNLDFIDEVFVADVIVHEPDRELHGPEQVKRYNAAYLEAFPDLTVSFDDVIAEGDKVVPLDVSRHPPGRDRGAWPSHWEADRA